MNRKRILVYSVDAMVCEDLDKLREMPNFQRYLSGGCEVTEGMRTVYPSVTYPAHVSMMTGCYPDAHGVTSNFAFTTENKNQNWLWFSDAYKVEDLFSAAKKAGYTTGAISWPVTAGNKNIDWLMAEYWMPNKGDTLRSSFKDAGSSEEMLDIIERNAGYLPKGYEKGGKANFMQWPAVDDFIIHVAADVIRHHAPEVMFVHTGTFDSFRHTYGAFSNHMEEAVANLDTYLGKLMEAYSDAGVFGDTNLVLVSDHGQRDICRVLNLNVLLADGGFIETERDGTIKNWHAFAFSNAMSALVYLKEPEDKLLEKQVQEYLEGLRAEGIYGIGKLFGREEIERKEHLTGEFSFVIESDGYTSFSDRAVRPLVQNFDVSDYRMGRATHGYLPELGPQPIFVAKGPDFAENTFLKRGDIVSEAPTYAKLLGIELPQAQGVPMDIFLKETGKKIK